MLQPSTAGSRYRKLYRVTQQPLLYHTEKVTVDHRTNLCVWEHGKSDIFGNIYRVLYRVFQRCLLRYTENFAELYGDTFCATRYLISDISGEKVLVLVGIIY